MGNFSEKLKKIRKEKGLTQQELAKIGGITYKTLANYETNRSEPNFSFLKNILQEFPQYLNYLFDLEEEIKQDTAKSEELKTKQEEINNKQKEEIRDLKSKIDKVERTISNLINNNKNIPLA